MPFLIWGLKSPDRELQTLHRGHLFVQRWRPFNMWTKILLPFTRTHSLLQDNILLILLFVEKMDRKRRDHKDQKEYQTKNCWLTLNIAASYCRWPAKRSALNVVSSVEFWPYGAIKALSSWKSSDQNTIRGLCMWNAAWRSMFTYLRATWVQMKFHVSPN